MGTVQEAVRGKLINSAGVTAICSTRVYPGMIPTGARLPAITYAQMSRGSVHAMQRDANLSNPLFQVSLFSTSAAQAGALASQVRAALKDYSGSTWASIQRIFIEDETWLTEIDPDSKRMVFQVAQEYEIWWST